MSPKKQLVDESHTQLVSHTANRGRSVNSTTAGKLQRFYAEHSTPSPRSASPSNTAPTADKLQPLRLKTGLDALQHFARHGLDATPKLLHCLQACAPSAMPPAARGSTAKQEAAADTLQDTQNPYDLRVVPRAQLPASYLTVTATGVVEVPGDGAPSVHIPVGQWLRHASLHELLSGLSAGGQMLKSSVLRRWQATAQQQRFQQRRQQLGQALLLLKPAFHRVLAESRARLAQLHAEGPLAPMEEGMFSLEALISTQQEYQQSKLAPLLARAITGITSDIEQLAGRLQSSERLLRREVEEYRKDPSAGASQGLCPVKVQAERAAITAKHATALQDLQRLPCFLRLLAQVILQSQLDLLVATVCGLRQHLQAPGNALHVDLLLQGPGVHMSPSQDDTLKGLSKGVMEHLVGILLAAPRLLKHHSIATLLADPVNAVISDVGRGSMAGSCFASSDGTARSPGLHKGPSVVSGKALRAAAEASAHAQAAVVLSAWLGEGEGQEGRREGGQLLMMVVGDKSLQTFRRLLDQHVMRSYREAQQVADALSELGVLLRFASIYDPKAYKARQHTMAGLRKDAVLLREWQAQLQVVLDSQCVGMLRLETASLKATYANTLSSAQATTAMMMVVAARRAVEAATDKLQSVTSGLCQQPSKLPDFISFRLEVRGVRQQQEDLLVALPAQVNDLYATIKAWGYRLPHSDQALLDDVKEACRGCGAALTAAVAFLDSRQLGMVALLDRQAKELLKQVQELLKRLEDASMAQRLGLPASVAADMWQQQIAQLSEAAATVNEQERLLDMRCTHYGDLEEAQQVLQEMQQQQQLVR